MVTPPTPRRVGRRALILITVVALAIVNVVLLAAPPSVAAAEPDHLTSVSGSGLFSYSERLETGSPAGTVSFGSVGDQPLLGDWDCDGTDTPGVYRSKDARVFLSNGIQTGRTDFDMFYGIPGDIALAGDFDGDGCDTIAVYRNGEAAFHVRNTLTEGWADVIIDLGDPGDKPFVGDFDGDGKDTFGVYRGDRVYLSNRLEYSVAQRSYLYGNPGDVPVVGDFDGDGRDTVALYRPSTGYVHLQGKSPVYVGRGMTVLSATVSGGFTTNGSLPAEPAPEPVPAPQPAPSPAPAPPPSVPEPGPVPPPPPIDSYEVDVDLHPGDDLRAAAANAPEGTVFRINGTHTGQQIAPRNGQVFLGAPGAKLDGAGAGNAIRSGASDVVVAGLEITGYSPGAQNGVVQAEGDRWVVRNNNIHHNGGVGARFLRAHGSQLLQNAIHHQEQLGINVTYANDVLIEDNEIAYNNWEVKYDWGWEAGGTKFWGTDRLVVRGNWSHHNHGPGLWTDFDNVDTVYEDNVVEDNAGPGIYHEISYDAIIRNNVARRNGFGQAVWMFGGGITLSTSQGVEVYGNEIVGNHNGITMVEQNRGSGRLGPWVTRNNHVHDNTVVDSGKSGAAQDVGSTAIFAGSNRFEANEYVGDVWWDWDNAPRSWDAWRSYGLDPNGSYRD